MSRQFNFSAGPATLPTEVLQQAADEMLEWRDAGCGVMEMSHRGRHFQDIFAQTEARLCRLLAVPDDYDILFLQGGARLQFSQIPMNLLAGGEADYLVTGAWSHKAWQAARQMAPAIGAQVRLVYDEAPPYLAAPLPSQMQCRDHARYLHLCTNETIDGVEIADPALLPSTAAPLVADMSSHLLSRRLDVSRFGVIYAGAQKNIGLVGLTLVIIRRDLPRSPWAGTPAMLDFTAMAQQHSMLNTPPTYAIYMAGLVFEWLEKQGGLAVIEQRNCEKAALLYRKLDDSDFYTNRVEKAYRSWMNVPFALYDDRLNNAFLAGAQAAGLAQLKGHASVGGMRASLYNAMPLAGVEALVEYMHDFEKKQG